MESKIYTKYIRPPKTYESGGRVSQVEVGGYVSMQRRIEDMMLAGQRLVMYRQQQFDAPAYSGQGGVDEYDDGIQCDPTRRGDYDWVDADRDLAAINSRQKKKVVDGPVRGVQSPVPAGPEVKEDVKPDNA